MAIAIGRLDLGVARRADRRIGGDRANGNSVGLGGAQVGRQYTIADKDCPWTVVLIPATTQASAEGNRKKLRMTFTPVEASNPPDIGISPALQDTMQKLGNVLGCNEHCVRCSTSGAVIAFGPVAPC
jgi:hypothetical protein